MAFIEVSDFVGFFQLPKDTFNTSILQKIIDDKRNTFIYKIFGATFGNEIIDYIDSTPTPDPLLDKLINPFQEDLCNSILDSKGLKYALLGLIYLEKQKDSLVSTTAVNGVTRSKLENSTPELLPVAQTYERYNGAVLTIEAIQDWIRYSSVDYPDFNGQEFGYSYNL